jgi:Ca2+-binding RTX toxin-like protein
MSGHWFDRLIAGLRGTGATQKRFNDALRPIRRRQRTRLGIELLEGRQLLVASLTINDVSILEGNTGTSNLNFTVTRSGDDTLSAVTVGYATADGTATAGSDYTAQSGTVTIPSGSTTASISVPVWGDSTVEPVEQFFLNLTGITNVTGPAAILSARNDFPTGTNPWSVAIGDLNGDGKQDLAIANSFSDSVSVLLNTTATGATTPSYARTDFATGTQPVSVTIGDLNGDGKQDLAIANKGSSTVAVLLNTTATGAITPSYAIRTDFTTGTQPVSVAIGDLNGDGKPDLAVANSGAASVSVLRNTTATGATTPSYAAKTDFTTGTQPASVIIGDLNGDGKQDLAIANSGAASVSVLRNTTATGATTPSYAARTDFITGTQPVSVAIGDLNGDGKQDLAIANKGSSTVSVLINSTTSGAITPSYAAKTDFGTGANPWSVAIGDLNGDGKQDLAIANKGSSTVSVLINSTTPGATTPSYAARTDFTTGTQPVSVAIGDLDGDGKPDLAVANSGAASVSVLRNTTLLPAAAVALTSNTDFGTGSSPYSTAIGDLNGDGKPDLAIANKGSSTVSVLINTTTPGAITPSYAAKTDFGTGANPWSVAIGDLNGDGKPDLAIANSFSNSVSVLMNTTTPGATTPSYAGRIDFTTGIQPVSVAIGDLNGDGKQDLAIANSFSNSVSVLMNTTTPGATRPSYFARSDFTTGANPWSVAIGDLNGDGKPDLAIPNRNSNSVSVLMNTTAPGATAPSYAPRTDFTTGTWPRSVAIGDLNGDGKQDLAIANSFSDSVSVLMNTTLPGATTPSYDPRTDFRTGIQPVSVAIGDLNGDGKQDLAVANAGAASVSVLRNITALGATSPIYTARTDFGTGSGPYSVAIGDLNGDGRSDLAIPNNSSNSVSVLINPPATISDNQAIGMILPDDGILGAATASPFTTTYGTVSSTQIFSISGFLLKADIVATAPPGFEVSSGGAYGADATFTQSGGTVSGTLSIRLAATAPVTGSYDSKSIVLSSTGVPSINITTSSSGNIVSKAQLSITADSNTGTSAVDAFGKTYDGSVYTGFTACYCGFVNSETAAVLAGELSFIGAGTMAINAGGPYSITPSGLTSSNYTIVFVSGSLNIDRKALTATASAASKKYDGNTNTTINCVITGGLVGNETVTASSTGTFGDKIVGNAKPVTANSPILADGTNGGLAANYSMTPPGGLTADLTARTDGARGNDVFTVTLGTSFISVVLETNDFGTYALDSTFTLNGLSGTGIVNVIGTAEDDLISITGTGITVNGATITLNSMEFVSIDAGAGADTFSVINPPSGVTKLALSGNTGDDLYQLDADNTLGLVSLTENAGEGFDTIDLSPTTASVALHLGPFTTNQTIVSGKLMLQLNAEDTFDGAKGGAGNDTLTGNSLNNVLTGGNGSDTLNGGAGNDELLGGLGDDVYRFTTSVGSEADLIREFAAQGTDRVDFSELTVGVTFSLGTSAIQSVHAGRTLQLNSNSTFENLTGGAAADTLTGNASGNVLTGNAGNDVLIGLGGNDNIFGGLNDDTYIFTAAPAAEADQVNEYSNQGTDTLSFVSLTTAVTLSLNSVSVQSAHINRTVVLNSAATFENIDGGTASDTLIGNALDNQLRGGDGNNILVGLHGNDRLESGSGRDILIGGPGFDTLNGGTNDDILIAGRTTSDTDVAKLNTIRTEWISANAYPTRVANLRAGIGSSAVSLKATVNVLNDATRYDALTGGPGTNWYFRALDDVITDLFAGETIDAL